jgi:transposase-like protein
VHRLAQQRVAHGAADHARLFARAIKGAKNTLQPRIIKKRRALQILGLSTPLSTSEVKRLLEEMLKDKTLK